MRHIEPAPPLPADPELARAQLVTEAREVLLKCMRGQVDPRTAEVQRKASLDVLNGALDGLVEKVIAELKRRRAEISTQPLPEDEVAAAEAAAKGKT